MICWKKSSHIPEAGSKLLVYLKNSKELTGPIFYQIRDDEDLSHIEKWCYVSEYEEYCNRKLKGIL